MTHRTATPPRTDLERHRLPLALRFLAGLAAINVLATMLSLGRWTVGPLFW